MSVPPGVVVVLDGPSCVGKTTTLEALQEAWPRVRPGPLLDLGLDRTLGTFGPRGLGRWWELILRADRDPDGEVSRVGWGPLGRDLVEVMHRVAAIWAGTGWDVALDHVLLDRATARDLRTVLDGLPVLHVALVCDPVVLADREAEQHREQGQAVVEARQTAHVSDRDLVLDTTEATTEELVEVILGELATRWPSSS
jgi:chloramphenicol 3-O phosphotransferase